MTAPAPAFGIYIHWPFCQSKCPYCDFNSHVAEHIDQAAWRAAYLAELDHYASETDQRTVTSLFFGDGPLAELSASVSSGYRHDAVDVFGPAGEIPPLKDVSRLAAMEAEGVVIRRALEKTEWNRRRAAELLQISYKALLYKMRDCGIKAA